MEPLNPQDFCQHDWFDLRNQPEVTEVWFFCRMCLSMKKVELPVTK